LAQQERKRKKMKAKLLLLGIVSLIAARTLTAQENWRLVRKSAEITGTWAGSMTIPTPADNGMPASSVDMYLVLEYDDVAEYIDMELELDSEQFLDDMFDYAGETGDAIALLGIDKPMLWNIIKTEIANMDEVIEVGDYYITMAISDFVSGNGMGDSDIYINKDKTLLKIGIDRIEGLFPGSTDDYTEFILERQTD
jgi:hypothetical protein